MKKRSITLLFFAVAATSAAVVAQPAEACCYFRFRGVSCGPDSHAQIYVHSTGPSGGYVNGQYAYVHLNFLTLSGFHVGTGNRTINIPSRILDSYEVVAGGGATITAHSAGCS
jgi:hypothetical protein